MSPGSGAMLRITVSVRNALRTLAGAITRLDYTPGDRHIEAIVRDCLDRRLPPDVTARRLMVASDIAQVLDADRPTTPAEALLALARATDREATR